MRGALAPVDQPGLGDAPVPVPRSALRFRGRPLPPLEPAPLLGADDDVIYRRWLGLGAGDLAELRASGLIAGP